MLKLSLVAGCLIGCAAFGGSPVYADDAKPVAPQQAKPAAPANGCTKDTGSRLRRNTDGCPGVGTSYTKDDMIRTGEPNAGGALRRLDPSITGGH
jgi:hypothetical protein